MTRCKFTALLIAALLLANPVLACCAAMQDMLNGSVAMEVDTAGCHGSEGEAQERETPQADPCPGCEGCESIMVLPDLLKVQAVPVSKDHPGNHIVAQHYPDVPIDWGGEHQTTGPPATQERPPETPVRRKQLLLI